MNLKAKKNIRTTIYHLFVIAFGLLMIYPVIWMVISSFKMKSEILGSNAPFFPSEWVWQNYPDGWQGAGEYTFATYFKNSIIISVLSTLGTVISSAMVSYALARVKFKGRKFWFLCMIMTMLLPGQVLMIPQYIIWNNLNLVGTFVPMILPKFLGVPFFIYMMMQFIKGLPKELDEAAMIDGCNRYQIFSRIILPLLGPSIITTVVIQFYWVWDDYMGPLLYLTKPGLYTVSYAIKNFADVQGTNFGPMFAMSTLSLIPVFLLFLFFNRYLMEGVTAGSVKG
ncbi:MAG TPA: carbohydrate ABC transporter permease [Candidatus Limivivens intestinipullorum]|uniref:Carbohydrate ABC transporter permease n=1 Tax=Candidatus Limivivens intestinipullorum TaxID=2840858 RepID=A0A9D1ERA6_9FIRM|nr:carbohydrate ABC transporter permease [Candidatus Limivivens intestinipullorum]